ncbi:uncharacterized protein LOC135626528 isoform X1 [Musa acuminata AAA Group]|uniref:uncharacterized protein LOC135597413 isoform X1 n=1 Tax=Musa acuminata AAA Group TaxID=214697 RepID=UPI0031E1D76F
MNRVLRSAVVGAAAEANRHRNGPSRSPRFEKMRRGGRLFTFCSLPLLRRIFSQSIMNRVLRSALVGSPVSPLSPMPVSFFHSTPVLERRRKNYWYPRFNYYGKRKRKMESKRTQVRNLSDYAEYLFQSWRDEVEQNSSTRETPWFRRHYGAMGAMKNGYHDPQWESNSNKKKRVFEFYQSDDDDDDDDVENIFHSAFGGTRFSYWSFHSSQDSHWSHSGHTSHKSRNWTYETDDENDYSAQPEFTSERLALGLRAFGPLNIEEVKRAYRTCALKWHPDRHQGSSKEAAEEKFKHCSAAYKTLCNKLAIGECSVRSC